jgi:hypothetical protein
VEQELLLIDYRALKTDIATAKMIAPRRALTNAGVRIT